jgi:hypothetical protein
MSNALLSTGMAKFLGVEGAREAVSATSDTGLD